MRAFIKAIHITTQAAWWETSDEANGNAWRFTFDGRLTTAFWIKSRRFSSRSLKARGIVVENS
jgi:hypothetical protein